MKELIVFTHNDLDAVGAMLNIEIAFPGIPKKYFHTNYANIKEKVQEIETYINENNDGSGTHIIIPDVSFSDNKDSLRKLYKLGNCVHIDHHLYPDDFWDEFPDMTVVYDKTKCATKLCHEYFKNQGKNPNLDKLTYVIDVYDLWQTKSPAFHIAQDLNEYFWQHEIGFLCQKFIQNNYDLPHDYAAVVDGLHKTFNAALKDYEDRKLIYRGGDITVAFVNDYFNQILIREMENGQNIVVGANSFGIMRVRIKEEAPFTDDMKNEFRLRLTGTKDIGHTNAFTWKMKGVPGFNTIMSEIKNIVNVIMEVRNECR